MHASSGKELEGGCLPADGLDRGRTPDSWLMAGMRLLISRCNSIGYSLQTQPHE